MLDDSTCVSEVTSAISRIRMQSSTVNKTALSSSDDINSAPQSPNTPVRESPDGPLTNAFRWDQWFHWMDYQEMRLNTTFRWKYIKTMYVVSAIYSGISDTVTE